MAALYDDLRILDILISYAHSMQRFEYPHTEILEFLLLKSF